MLDLIEVAGFSIPRLQLHYIKKQISKLCGENKVHKKYQEINYWGQIMAKKKDYYVIIGIRRQLGLGLGSMDFWVSQDMFNWVFLKPSTPEIIRLVK